MVSYPIRVPYRMYRGSNEAKRRKAYDDLETIRSLEEYINKEFLRDFEESSEKIQAFTSGGIAHEAHLPLELVKRLLAPLTGGGNGFTVNCRVKASHDRPHL